MKTSEIDNYNIPEITPDARGSQKDSGGWDLGGTGKTDGSSKTDPSWVDDWWEALTGLFSETPDVPSEPEPNSEKDDDYLKTGESAESVKKKYGIGKDKILNVEVVKTGKDGMPQSEKIWWNPDSNKIKELEELPGILNIDTTYKAYDKYY